MRTLSPILLLAGLAAAAAPAVAQRFSFRAVEFAPADERLGRAQAFVAQVAAPGTPLAAATAALRHAGAACAGSPDITCTASRMVTRSDLDTGVLADVTWTVRLVRGPDDRVAAAAVTREVAGG